MVTEYTGRKLEIKRVQQVEKERIEIEKITAEAIDLPSLSIINITTM